MIITVGSKVKDKDGNLYLLNKEIGQGGFGCVYQAENEGRVFAVKTLLHSFVDQDAIISFKNEIFHAEKIKGDNIIHYEYIHNGEEYPELPPYIIMEFAEGGTLKSKIDARKAANTPFSKDELVAIYKQLINGMAIINDSLVHRDIKPENILICGDTLKISDFGLAKIATENTRTMSMKGFGTFPYTSPEAWTNSKNTIQMDIYSMGIVFYELATFLYPYNIKAKTYEDYRDAHLFAAVQNTTALQQATNPSIASIITRMIEKSTQKRFSNWSEILALFDNQPDSNSKLDAVVQFAIAKKIEDDMATQRYIDEENRKRKEINDFYKLVHVQFESTIMDPIRRFVDQFNEQSAGVEKYQLQEIKKIQDIFEYKLSMPSYNYITIKCKVILPLSHKRLVEIDRVFRSEGARTEYYTPKYKDKDIIAWCEIENRDELGFNVFLSKGIDLYGDWYIFDNKNNMSNMTDKQYKEPFAFGVSNLESALVGLNAISLYCSIVTAFDENKFYDYILRLIH